MVKYIVKKILILCASLFTVATLTFFLMHAVPGDPFSEDQPIPQEIINAMMTHYGLDQPWYIQYGHFLKGLVTFDLGPSYKYQGRSVNAIIAQNFPVSLCLGLEALCIALACGLTLGTIASLKHSKWQDHLAMIFSVVGISVPSFILATMLQYLFSMKLGILPVARWGTFSHTILPALALAAMPTAFIARLTRASMIEVLEQDYIQTAKAKGVGTLQLICRHALKNSLLPVMSYIGYLSASILTGSFVVEKIFAIPGLGQWFVQSVMNRDYTVIMAVTLFYSAILMVSSFVVDILYGFLDPRIAWRKQ